MGQYADCSRQISLGLRVAEDIPAASCGGVVFGFCHSINRKEPAMKTLTRPEDVPWVVLDAMPNLAVPEAVAYARALGFADMTDRSVVDAMHRGELRYRLVRNRRATSRAAVRAWLSLTDEVEP